MSTISVRFLNNFIMTVIQTVEEDGQLVVKEKQIHISIGQVYAVSQYERNPDGRLDLHFPDSSPLAGVAHGVESDYCELVDSTTPPKVSSGCGGCGNKTRKKK